VLRVFTVHRNLLLLLAVVGCLAVSQVWLTWRMVEQDRDLAAQRSRERLEHVADLALAQLSSSLGEWTLGLTDLETFPPPVALKAQLPPEVTFIRITRQSVVTSPVRPLLFVPDFPSSSLEVTKEFDIPEQMEFRDFQYEHAIDALRGLAEKPPTRAEALLRMARVARKLNHTETAMAAYDRLLGETAIQTTGLPYAMLAAGARCELLAGTGDERRALTAAEGLHAALLEGRWPVRREAFEYYWAVMNRFRHTSHRPPEPMFEFSTLIQELYLNWQGTGRGPSSGRDARTDSSVVVWHATPDRLTALVTPRNWLRSNLTLAKNVNDVRWRFLPAGWQPGAEPYVIRTLSDAQLPGRMEFSLVNGGIHPESYSRTRLSGVALMLLLLIAGAYATYRGVSRELQVAHLQSDFVSAVSHEFRSPLTSLRSITELLASNRITDENRRRQSYNFMERETGRLHHLVEDLLDFGRMESGRKQYRIELLDIFGLVRSAVDDFGEVLVASGFSIEMNLDPRQANVQGDAEALRRAVRNLLENAVKYSPECRSIWIDGAIHGNQVSVSVRDHGMGIDPREQRRIFEKFVRGAAANKAGINGTGIGLSMVRQIVAACGGEIRLASSVGSGSTFTILFPLAGGGGPDA